MSRQVGFTLIELIMVVVILSIVSVLGGRFIVSTMTAYVEVEQRTTLLNYSHQAVEKMTRVLRTALPYSLRLTNNNQCLEFLPIISAGHYRNPVPDASNNAAASGAGRPLITAPYRLADSHTPLYMVIGAASADELYGAMTASLALVKSQTPTTVTLAAEKRWQRNSIAHRFFLVGSAQAFCLLNNELRFYQQQLLARDSVDIDADYILLAHNGRTTGDALFSISQANADRNVRIVVDIAFVQGNQRIDFNQEVVLRNVP